MMTSEPRRRPRRSRSNRRSELLAHRVEHARDRGVGLFVGDRGVEALQGDAHARLLRPSRTCGPRYSSKTERRCRARRARRDIGALELSAPRAVVDDEREVAIRRRETRRRTIVRRPVCRHALATSSKQRYALPGRPAAFASARIDAAQRAELASLDRHRRGLARVKHRRPCRAPNLGIAGRSPRAAAPRSRP